MAKKRNLKTEILMLRNEGLSYREIAKRLNCQKSLINYHCDKNNLTDIGMKLSPISTETKRAIAEFCKKNKNREAVEHFGVSLTTIKRYNKFQG